MAMKEIFMVIDDGCDLSADISHSVGIDMDIGDDESSQEISPILIFATVEEAEIYRELLLSEEEIELKGELIICRAYISIRDKIS